MDRAQALVNTLKAMLDQANANYATAAADLIVAYEELGAAKARIAELEKPPEA